jgi:hypothetical protein
MDEALGVAMNKEIMCDVLKAFTDAITTDPSYVGKFLTQLEIYKLEDKYQRPDKSCIFRKQYNDFGVVENFEIDAAYKGLVPMPKLEWTDDDFRHVLSMMGFLGTDNEAMRSGSALAFTLSYGLAESAIQQIFDYSPAGLPFERKLNEYGFVTWFKPKFKIEMHGKPKGN